MKSPYFLHVDTNSHKLKVDQKLFGWVWSKIGVACHVTDIESNPGATQNDCKSPVGHPKKIN